MTKSDFTRDEQAEKEAEEFDFTYSYVFGDQKRYKEDNCHGPYGTVIASYNIEQGGEVANVVYVAHDRPLYVIPASYFRPTRELMRRLTSNSQRLKRCENFALMDCVQLGHDEDNNLLWVIKASRHHNRLEFFSDGTIGIETLGAIKPAGYEEGDEWIERRLWTEKIGYFDFITLDKLDDYIPNVAYSLRFQLVTQPSLQDEDNLQPETLRIANFHPTFQFELPAFLSVDDMRPDIVESLPWNFSGDVGLMENSDQSDELWTFALEGDKLKPERSQAIKDVQCLTVSKTNLYSPQFGGKTIMVPWRGYWELVPGTFVDVSLVHSKFSDVYIVFDCSQVYDSLPFKGEATEEAPKFMVEVEIADYEDFFFHPFFGLIYDGLHLLKHVRGSDKQVVWIQHESGGNEVHRSNFIIHSLAPSV